MNKNVRLTLQDTAMSAIIKLSEGNPGAARALVECIEQGAAIDPDSMLGGMGVLFSLDTYGIYGSNIWILYKDISGQDVVTMLAILRAVQLGLMFHEDLFASIESCRMDAAFIKSIVAQVKERLPAFGVAVANVG